MNKVWNIILGWIYGPYAAQLRAMTDEQLARHKASLAANFRRSASENRLGSSHGLWLAESRAIRHSVADIEEEQLHRQLKRERVKIQRRISFIRRRHAAAS